MISTASVDAKQAQLETQRGGLASFGAFPCPEAKVHLSVDYETLEDAMAGAQSALCEQYGTVWRTTWVPLPGVLPSAGVKFLAHCEGEDGSITPRAAYIRRGADAKYRISMYPYGMEWSR